MKQYGVSETFCWNLQRSAKRQKVSQFLAKAETGSKSAKQPGSHLALVHMVSQSAGKKMPGGGESTRQARPPSQCLARTASSALAALAFFRLLCLASGLAKPPALASFPRGNPVCSRLDCLCLLSS